MDQLAAWIAVFVLVAASSARAAEPEDDEGSRKGDSQEPMDDSQEPMDDSQEPGRLLLRVGAVGTVSDEAETKASRAGGFLVAAGWQLKARPQLLVVGVGRQLYSSQEHIPEGAEAGVSVDETRTEFLGAAKFRLLDEPSFLSVYAVTGPRFIDLRSEITDKWMLGLLLGAEAEARVHDGLVFDAGFGWAHRILGGEDDGSRLGGFLTTYTYTAGFSLRFVPTWRIRVGYLGDFWVFEKTDRVGHGGELSIEARLL